MLASAWFWSIRPRHCQSLDDGSLVEIQLKFLHQDTKTSSSYTSSRLTGAAPFFGHAGQISPLVLAHPTYTQPALLQQLHILQGRSHLSHLAQLLQADQLLELTAELDVHHAPLGIIWLGRCVVVRGFGVMRRYFV